MADKQQQDENEDKGVHMSMIGFDSSAEEVAAFYKQLTGKEASKEEIEEVRKMLKENGEPPKDGKWADIAVLDMKSTPLIAYRMEQARDLGERLFVQMTLGDDRAIQATYVAGRLAYKRRR